MTSVLEPQLALEYLAGLCADVRGAVVLGADGTLLAGEPDLAPPARALLAAAPDAAALEVRVDRGLVLAARSATHAVAVACGPLALAGPARLDVATVLEGLRAR